MTTKVTIVRTDCLHLGEVQEQVRLSGEFLERSVIEIRKRNLRYDHVVLMAPRKSCGVMWPLVNAVNDRVRQTSLGDGAGLIRCHTMHVISHARSNSHGCAKKMFNSTLDRLRRRIHDTRQRVHLYNRVRSHWTRTNRHGLRDRVT
jgi:hypothetical protein